MKNLSHFMNILEVMRSSFIIQIEIDEVDYTCRVFNESEENEEYLFLSFSVEADSLEDVVLKAWEKLISLKEEE